MGIVEGSGGTQADVSATVWDLAEGFAIIARATARNLTQTQAKDLHVILSRMALRAADLDREYLADVLAEARDRVGVQAE